MALQEVVVKVMVETDDVILFKNDVISLSVCSMKLAHASRSMVGVVPVAQEVSKELARIVTNMSKVRLAAE